MAMAVALALAFGTPSARDVLALENCFGRPTVVERIASAIGMGESWRRFRYGRIDQFEMYDGFTRDKHGEMTAGAATVLSAEIEDEGAWWVDGDEVDLWLYVVIPDADVKALPFDVRLDGASCSCSTVSAWLGRDVPRGCVRVLRAVSSGFIVQFDTTCNGHRFGRVAIFKSVGPRRVGVWPYSPIPPGESWQEKLAQSVEDAWNGLW